MADLDQAVAEIEYRGIPSPPIEVVAGAGRKASVTDPEGNTITFIEVE